MPPRTQPSSGAVCRLEIHRSDLPPWCPSLLPGPCESALVPDEPQLLDQLTTLMHLDHNVAATRKLSIKVHLRDRGPISARVEGRGAETDAGVRARWQSSGAAAAGRRKRAPAIQRRRAWQGASNARVLFDAFADVLVFQHIRRRHLADVNTWCRRAVPAGPTSGPPRRAGKMTAETGPLSRERATAGRTAAS